MIRRPPRSTLDRSSAASDVYKRQEDTDTTGIVTGGLAGLYYGYEDIPSNWIDQIIRAVSYTHLRAHETVLDLVCRLLLEKKKQTRLINVRLLFSQSNKQVCTTLSRTRTSKL